MHASPLNTTSSPFSFSTMSASTSGPNLGSSSYGINNPNYHTSAGYQSGYLSTSLLTPSNPSSQANAQTQSDANDSNTPSGPPIVPTKAKMNHLFASGPSASNKAGDFGLSSRFGMSSRQLDYQMDDEDAPPTMSINDEDSTMGNQPMSPGSLRQSAGPGWFTGEHSNKKLANTQRAPTYTYVVVFGYPPSKYVQTASHFQSLSSGEMFDRNDANEIPSVTAPEPMDIMNAFKIGYLDPSDAMRAVRRNGEVIGGEWMIGVRYADSNQQSQPQSPPLQLQQAQPQQKNLASSSSERQRMNTNLMPSSSAFRTPVKGGGGGHQQHVTPSNFANSPATPQTDGSPNKKGMLGQVSDMIFGW